MGFQMLALQEKGDEVWKVLEAAKTEFGKFGKLMDKVEGDVGKIQRTLGEVGVRTRAINRSLREVSAGDAAMLEFEDVGGGLRAGGGGRGVRVGLSGVGFRFCGGSKGQSKRRFPSGMTNKGNDKKGSRV